MGDRYWRLSLGRRIRQREPFLKVVEQERQGQLLTIGHVRNSRIDRKTCALDWSRRQAIPQRLVFTDEGIANLFLDHPLHMVSVEGRVRHS